MNGHQHRLPRSDSCPSSNDQCLDDAAIDRIMRGIFPTGKGLQRSEAYQLGCRHIIESKIAHTDSACPYAPGSAEFDAYFAGMREGFARASEILGSGRHARPT